MLGVRGPSSSTGAGCSPSCVKAGYRSVSGITDQNGTPLKSHSGHGPPESASHGVPTASTAQPNPVCGDTKTEHASTNASCSNSGRSTARTTFPAAAAIRSSHSCVAEVDVRLSRSSFADEAEDGVRELGRQRLDDQLPRRDRRVAGGLARAGRHQRDPHRRRAQLSLRALPQLRRQLEP